MLEMRVLAAAAVIAFGIAGADAADLDFSRGYSATVNRSGQIVLYDYQPGVVVRAYWAAPWGHRHYYPTTGDKPASGRDEDLTVTSSAPKPAETFQRSWSTCAVCLGGRLPAGMDERDAGPELRDEQFSQPPLK
jgi:hypothetical protein